MMNDKKLIDPHSGQAISVDEAGKLQFPCDVTVKAMGNATETFTSEIFDICKQHVPELQKSDVQTRQSSAGKYTSVNVKINAKSREQLEKLYQDLNDHPDVHMTL